MQTPDVVDRFLAYATDHPDCPAIALRSGITSYGELVDRVRQYATAIVGRGATRVMIALPQGLDAYAAMFAAGLAGGYYIPVNVSTPVEKLQLVLRAAIPDVIMVDATISPIFLDVIREELPNTPILDVQNLHTAASLGTFRVKHEIGYVIFTSGTTGVPKGVVVPRSALNHYIDWAIEALNLGAGDRISQHPNIGFDLSVLDIYGALCSGATLCPLIGAGDRLMPARFVADLKITVWISVPSVISLMLNARQIHSSNLHSVRLFLFCGEPLLRDHLDKIFEACPTATVFNTYGPTECTVSVTHIKLHAHSFTEACTTSVALGNPIPGVELHLVGGQHPDEGEIVITGKQVALGYWNDPERTAERFRPFDSSDTLTRSYFTGDWAERRGSHLFFRERTDFQIKLNGFRIELDEIAAAIRACGWSTVCVFKYEDSIVAIVETQERMSFDAVILRAEIAKKVEHYAVPKEFREIAKMPRNLNDKLDRDAVRFWYAQQISSSR